MFDFFGAAYKMNQNLDSSYTPKSQSLMPTPMEVANFSFTIVTTSALIALVHSPINTLLMNQIKTGKFIATDTHTSMSRLIFIRQFYTGFASCFAGVGTRTTYMSGAKKVDQQNKNSHDVDSSTTAVRPEREEHYIKKVVTSIASLSLMSLGEVVVTQIPEVLSTLRKAEVINSDFKWYIPRYFVPLATASSGARFAFSFINFFSLCEIEQLYANSLAIQNHTLRHFSAGMLSGITAAIISYPFAHYRDYYLSKMRVEGVQLISPGIVALWREHQVYTQKVGFHAVLKTTLSDFYYVAPLRALRAGTRFGLIAGVSSFLGDKPCEHLSAKIGLFSSTAADATCDSSNFPVLKK